MSEQIEIEGESLELAHYAQQAYLEYALSVVKGRALPDVCDGQKPVQRRILYSMSRMGLGFGGANGNSGARPVKSARVVGDVLGRFHPHGDQAAYDAMVRMAQDFSQRYPLVDGQGNFGSRDGDNAAAMRYTEARLSKITTLLMDEIDMGTVEFIPNYDGSTEEPRQLPARLPFNLLNGASGIAVGLATEIPSHNLGEVASACVALIKDPKLPDDELFAILPAPDYPSGGQIISSAADIAQAYKTGRGSLKVRARWHIEDLARGQWQLVIDELPPGVSTASVLGEIEEISNPKVKTGKKALLTEQVQLKATFLSVVDTVRDESNKDAMVRIVIEPKSSRVEQQDLITTLLAHTSLETSSSINMTAIGIDGRPIQKSLRQMLNEWIMFRAQTIERRSKHRLGKVLERIHILEGRALVLLNIDEVIAIIRQSDEPKAALIARFKLSDRQAEDILEIRLRQLARLEAIKIEQELAELRKEQEKLEEILNSPATLKRLMIKEIEADAKVFTDARRTLIQEEKRVTLEIKIVDEPMTVIVSERGWVRTQKAHGIDTSTLPFKTGDALHSVFECRSIDALIVFGTANDKGVRVYSVAVSLLPGGRGDGQPISSLIELEAGTQAQYYFAGAVEEQLLLSSSGGYGFYASVANMISRQKAGKAFVSLGEHDGKGESLNAPVHIPTQLSNASQATSAMASQPPSPAKQVVCGTREGRLLSFALTDLRQMAGGGRGLMLMDVDAKDVLAGVAVIAQGASAMLYGAGRGGKEKTEKLDHKMIAMTAAPRGRKGKVLDVGFKITGIKAI
jgi:topoisomerase IV subunit A